MKKLLLILFIFLISGCSNPSFNGGNKIDKVEKLEVDKDKILYSETIDYIKCNNDFNCVNKGKIKKYYYAGDIVSANNYKINGKDILEDITKRTPDTETFCDGNDCIKKQYLSDKYVKYDVSKILKSATSTLEDWGEDFYGDTDVGSTNNKDTELRSNLPNTIFGASTIIVVGYYVSQSRAERVLISFTLSSGSGEITAIKFYGYFENNASGANLSIDVHEMTQPYWVEAQATWNRYSTANTWTTAGGDYSATVVDTASTPGSLPGWANWVLYGAGATNPLSVSWGDDVALLLKKTSESGSQLASMYSKEHADTSKLPYIEITYTPGGGATKVYPKPNLIWIN